MSGNRVLWTLSCVLAFCGSARAGFESPAPSANGSLMRFQATQAKVEEMHQQMNQHKNQIEQQATALEAARANAKDIAQKLHEVEQFVESFKYLQDAQQENYDGLLKQAKSLQSRMSSELAEKDARIAQLEYRIRKLHQQDPYVEKFEYPMEKFWIALDFEGTDSLWEFKRGEGDGNVISQDKDISSYDLPATALVLKSHSLQDGFVSAEISIKRDALSARALGEAGLVFKAANPKNFWMVGIGRQAFQGQVYLARISDGAVSRIAESRVEISPDRFYNVACEFTSKHIAVFIDGVLRLKVDLTTAPSTDRGSAGVYTSAGKACFRNFASGPIFFEKLAPEGAFHSVSYETKSATTTQIATDEKELRLLRGSSAEFRQLDLSNDNGAVPRIPYSSGDYEYTEPNEGVKFEPDSPLHVPDEPASQEVYDGFFHKENAQYRMEVNQTQHALPVSPGVPSCRAYSRASVNLDDWSSSAPLAWRTVPELGLQRLITSKLPGAQNQALTLKDSACNAAKYSMNLRLESDSEGGIVFRSDDTNNRYLVTVDVEQQKLDLIQEKDGVMTVLESKKMGHLKPQSRHKIEIIDYGERHGGMIHAYIDHQPVLSHSGNIYKGVGKAGIWLKSGYGYFDSFEIAPY